MAIAVPIAGSPISVSSFGGPVATLLNALGYAASNNDTVSNTGTTTTEVVSSGCFLNAVSGIRYGIFYNGAYESTIVGDQMQHQLKYAFSGSFSTTGTAISSVVNTATVASKASAYFQLGNFVAAATGLVAVSATIKRISGTGTVKQNGTATGQSLQWLILALGTN